MTKEIKRKRGLSKPGSRRKPSNEIPQTPMTLPMGNQLKSSQKQRKKQLNQKGNSQVKPKFPNLYQGYHPSGSPGTPCNLPQVDANEITPEEFFRNYVVTRTPCVIRHESKLCNPEFMKQWTCLRYLEQRAGDQLVGVEKKGSNGTALPSKGKLRISMNDFSFKLK
jgi:hypothetical protein